MIHSEDGATVTATPLLSTAQRYLPSHSSSYRTIPSVPLQLSEHLLLWRWCDGLVGRVQRTHQLTVRGLPEPFTYRKTSNKI